jgi:hypothetical protein
VRRAVQVNLDHLARGAGGVVYIKEVAKKADDADGAHLATLSAINLPVRTFR